MPSTVHFLTSKSVSGIKMGDNRLLCESSAAALRSPLPASKEVWDKRWLRLTWEEKVKRETFWVTHFFNGPYRLPQWYWSISVIFTEWIINFLAVKAFETKASSWLGSFLADTKVLIWYSIFHQERFHSDELHLFEAYRIGSYTLLVKIVPILVTSIIVY